MGAIWLVFLAFPVGALFWERLEPWRVAVGLAGIVLFAAVYLQGFVRLPDEGAEGTAERRNAARLVAMTGLVGVVGAVAGSESLGMLPYVVALAMTTVRWSAALTVVAVCIGLPLLWYEDTGFLSLVVALVAGAVGLVRVLDERGAQHDRFTRELEIVTERDRVARDVHDVLGHSLTVVAAKAELADRLVDVDPERAHAELAQIQSLTREALAEIRATVAGLRVARLGDELEAARGALTSAGIAAEVPADVVDVDPRHRIVLAWVLREAVTNVVRHSSAGRCTVSLTRNALVVTDDGVGLTSAPEGNGLRGIRERIAQAGGVVDVGPGPGGRGARVEVRL